MKTSKRATEIALVFIPLGALFFYLSSKHLVTADVNLYYDIGRNLLSLKPYCSFDIYATSPEAYFPALPFTAPLWPLVAGISIRLLGTYGPWMINPLLLLASAFVFYRIAHRFLAHEQALMATALAFTSLPILLIAMYPWTETLGLLLLLLIVHQVLSGARPLHTGLLLALEGLTRPHYLLPALIITAIWSKRKRDLLTALLTSAVLLLTYEGVCLVLWKLPYPSMYLLPLNNFSPPIGKTDLGEAVIGYLHTLKDLLLNTPTLPIGVLALLLGFWLKQAQGLDGRVVKLLWTYLVLVVTYPVLFLILILKGVW